MNPDELGALKARYEPMSVGVRSDALAVNVSWPFPRFLEIRADGLRIRALGADVWISRIDVTRISRGPGYIRIHWNGGGRESSAVISNLWRIGTIADGMRAAGFDVPQ
jgi:hypothetical protein